MAQKILGDFYCAEDEEAGEASPLKVRIWLEDYSYFEVAYSLTYRHGFTASTPVDSN